MKGIIVEINGNEAVALSDDGLFQKMKNAGYYTGQIVKIIPERKSVSRLAAGLAGVAAAFVICTTGAFAYFTPTDYVSLDVNPSVEYSVNIFDRILNVKAANDDGEEILSGMDLDNKRIEEGIKTTLDRLIEDGYISDDPNGKVVIATSNDKQEEAEQLAAELEREIRTYLAGEKGIGADVEAEAVRPDRVQEARELGVTPGKLNLVEKLQESTSGAINREEWLAMPVKEINKAIKENRRLERDKVRDKDRDKDRDQDRDQDRDKTSGQDEAAGNEAVPAGNSSVKKDRPGSNGQNQDSWNQGRDGREPSSLPKDKDDTEDQIEGSNNKDRKNEEPGGDEEKKTDDEDGQPGGDNPGKGDEKVKEKEKEKD